MFSVVSRIRDDDTGNTKHVEWVHEDIVFGLEDQHDVDEHR